MTVRVTTGGRLHFGFLNLSLVHDRIYGGIGAAISAPELIVDVEPASDVIVDRPTVKRYATRAAEWLSVPGVRVEVRRSLPAHMGLGSGTQLALAVFAGIAAAYDREGPVREAAPDLGRGGRSGIGVTTFETGGFVVDAGQPADRFTTDRPRDGNWSVPRPIARHSLPSSWRFVVIVPDAPAGLHGRTEEASMRSIVERASPSIADEITGICLRRLLPSVVEDRIETFGRAVTEIGRLNGAWYADVQGGVYRPPVGDIVRSLESSSAVDGAGQSSWGPTVYGVTDERNANAAEDAARNALEECGITGEVQLVKPRNVGARIERIE